VLVRANRYRPHRRRGVTVLLTLSDWVRIVLAVSALLVPACRPAPPAEETALDRAAALVASGSYTAAEQAYREAFVAASEDPAPALGLADLYLAWSRPERGLAALAAATDRGAPPDAVDRRQLALLRAAGRWEEAGAIAEGMIAGDPTSLEALAVLTEVYLQRQDCAQAMATARQHVEAYGASAPTSSQATAPEAVAASARVWVVLAPSMTAESRGVAEGTISLAEGTISVAEGTISLAEGMVQSVDPELSAALHSQRPERDLVLGQRLIRGGWWGLAACVLARAAEDDGAGAQSAAHAGQTHTWLGEALVRLGHIREGEAHLRLAVDLDPDSALAWLLLGQHYTARGSLENARIALLNAQRLDPTNPVPCLAVAGLKAAMGRYDEVNTWIAAARVRAPMDPDIAKAAARFYLSRWLDDGGEGLEAARAAVRLAPEDAEAHMLVGWALLNDDRFAAAQRALEEAAALDPGLAEVYHLQAVAFDRSGAGAEAAVARTRAADLGYPAESDVPDLDELPTARP
jgi:Flp pilus assembly protein TadD